MSSPKDRSFSITSLWRPIKQGFLNFVAFKYGLSLYSILGKDKPSPKE